MKECEKDEIWVND